MPAQATAKSPSGAIFVLPRPRDPHFAGRQRVLESLHKSLTNGEGGRVQVIYGAPGVGKTHLALEYAYRYQDQFPLIEWLPAAAPNTLAVQFAKLGKRLGVAATATSGTDISRTILDELEKRNDWLLMFDNAPGPQEVRPYLPQRGGVIHGGNGVRAQSPAGGQHPHESGHRASPQGPD